MTMDLDLVEAELDRLTTDLLVPLRGSKSLDQRSLDALLDLVRGLQKSRAELHLIPPRLAGKLMLVFSQMLTEADYAPDPEAILRPAWNYGYEVEKFLLGPR